MSADSLVHLIDPQSGLEAEMALLRGGDDGVFAVLVELDNPSADHDVVLKVNLEPAAFIMLTVTDELGNVLSRPARKFDTSEVQQVDLVRLAPGSSQRWRVPIATQLEASRLPGPEMKGRLVVNVALLFCRVSAGQPPDDNAFAISVLTLYDMDVRFTRSALGEGG